MSRLLLCSIACACLVGCVSAEHPCDRDPVVYDEVHGSQATFRHVSVCELFGDIAAAAGVFRFDEIVGSAEPGPDGPQLRVTSDTEAVWFGDVESRFAFSFSGGCAGGGSFLVPSLSARSGERVVLVIADHTSPIATELHIFREVSPGRFSNPLLFTDGGVELEELRAIALAVRESSTCPYDEYFGVER